MKREKNSRKSLWLLLLITLFQLLIVASVGAAGETISFLSKEAIVFRFDNDEVTMPVSVVSSGEQDIIHLDFELLLTSSVNGKVEPFEGVNVESDIVEMAADSVESVQLSFSVEPGLELPTVPLTGDLILVGETISGTLVPSTRPVVINPRFSDKASIIFPASETLSFELGNEPAKIPIAINNSGTEEIHNLTFGLFLTTEEEGEIREFEEVEVAASISEISPKTVELVDLTFTLISEEIPSNSVSGLLIASGTIADKTQIPSASHPIAIMRLRNDAPFVYGVIGGAVFLATIIVLAAWVLRNDRNRYKLGDIVVLEKWSKNSWLSVFTAGTGILGIGATLTILPKESLAQLSTSQFILLWGFFAVLIPIAPLFFFITLQKPPEEEEKSPKLTGKTWGFLLTNILVFWGAGGQVLTTLSFAYAISRSNVLTTPPIAPLILVVLLVFALAAMGKYAAMTIRWELEEPQPTLSALP